MDSSVPGRCPAGLITAIRDITREHASWKQTEERVASVLRQRLPDPDILTPRQRAGHPDRYQTHLLHTEPDGSFSVLALAWRPGQATPIHDHVCWGALGVLQGAEYEEIFALKRDGTGLDPIATNENRAGDVVSFTPPGDIHRVSNRGGLIAISLHVYGADISRLSTSVRRIYDLPALQLAAPGSQ